MSATTTAKTATSGRSKSVGGNRLARAEIDGLNDIRGRDGLLREIGLVGRTVDHETIRQESSNVNPQSHLCIVPKARNRHAAARGAVVWFFRRCHVAAKLGPRSHAAQWTPTQRPTLGTSWADAE